MQTDKDEPLDLDSRSQSESNDESDDEKQSDSGLKGKLPDLSVDHHYEPEAHHEWFPSEQFFIAWLTVGCSGFICLCLVLTAHHIFNPGFQVGDVVERDILAPHATLMVDDAATRNAREVVRSTVIPVFKADRTTDSVTLARIRAKIAEVIALQKLGLAPLAALTTAEHMVLLKATNAEFAQLALAAVPASMPSELRQVRQKLVDKTHSQTLDGNKTIAAVRQERTALQQYLSNHPPVSDAQEVIALSLTAADMPGYVTSLNSSARRMCKVFFRLPVDDSSMWVDNVVEFMPDVWPEGLRRASASLVATLMDPNVTIDKEATEARALRVAEQVKPVMKQISAGQLLVARHHMITPEQIKTLQAIGITDVNRWPIIVGLWISLAAAVSLIALFLYTFEAKFLFSTRSLGLMYTVALITVALATVLGKTYPQMIPLPAAALVLAIFFGQRAAIAIILPIVIFLAVDRLVDFNNLIALGTAAGAAIGSYSRRRHALMSMGLVVGMAQAFGFLAALAVSQTPLSGTGLGSQMGLEFLGGIASSIAAIGTLPFLENMFGLVTPFRLAELTDADQPLLRRLEEYAPGTYQHSLAVANLAEAGARAIGGDVNLVRAGAYYHDVGKMVRPKYFIENQLGATNPHDSMTPEQSRERVLAHVTDGLALAKQYSLPKAVQDFIPMHQGTSLMAYFYHKACLRDGVEKVDPLFYRYPGPKPQSKESSIVMLADVSEAVTHSMKDPSQEQVEEAIAKVFQNRWEDSQFSESGLSYAELLRVKKAFVRVWRTLHHDRLKYPSTTTGRMAMPPADLPTAASLANNNVMGNEFPSSLLPDAPRAEAGTTAEAGKEQADSSNG